MSKGSSSSSSSSSSDDDLKLNLFWDLSNCN